MGSAERALLLDAFDSNWIAPLGPHVDQFEADLCVATGAQHCAALASGTAALHLALLLVGVERGDEVLVSTLTFAATANAVRYVGAVPTFIDCDAATWTMDPALLEATLEDRARLGRLPRAVVTVDLYGQCCDYDRISAACARFDVPVIQDAAEALGAEYRGRPAGSQGALSILSFNGNKIITTSGGGALLSDNEAWIRRARFLSTQARDPAPHYEHSTIGYNYRLSNLLAAVGRGQLQHLAERVESRRANFEYYRSVLGDLPGWTFMPDASYGRCTSWLTCATIDPDLFGADREAVRSALEAEEIEARPVWKPMHLQPVFAGLEVVGGSVSARLFEQGICLPSGSALSPAERSQVIQVIRAVGRH